MVTPLFELPWIENECRRVYGEVEQYGLPVDRARLETVLAELEGQCAGVRAEIETATGLRIVPSRGSDVQAAATALGVTLPRTDTGRVRCDQDTLSEFPALKPLAKLKSLQHRLSTARGVGARIFQGRLWPHYVFNSELGRPHCGDVNYMAWPECLHPVIRAEEGQRFLLADFEAMELRVLAAMSGDQGLQAALAEEDFHRATAARMFGKRPNEVTTEQRQTAKTLTYAILYGSTVSGVAYRLRVAPAQAAEFIARWRQSYPEATTFVRTVQRTGLRDGFVRTYHGRERDLRSLIRQDPAKARRLAINHVIQSTAGDLMRIGMINLWPEILKLGGRILGTVHDSYLMQVPTAVPLDGVLAVIRATAITANEPGFILRMKVSLGERWGDYNEEHCL